MRCPKGQCCAEPTLQGGNHAESPCGQIGRKRARPARVARGLRGRPQAARAPRRGARRRPGGERAVAAPRPAGREAPRAAADASRGRGGRRDGAPRPRQSRRRGRAAGRGARRDRLIRRGWRAAHGGAVACWPWPRRRDHGRPGVAAREPAAGRAHAGRGPRGARGRSQRRAAQRERRSRRRRHRRRAAREGTAVRLRRSRSRHRRRRTGLRRRVRHSRADRAGRRDRRDGGEATGRCGRPADRSAGRPHRRPPSARPPDRWYARPRRDPATSMTVTSTAPEALLGVYARVGPLLVAGEGSEVIAEDGTRYLDFVAGIAVNALGYNHPVFRGAVTRALESGLVHVSNLYRTEPGERLAAELIAHSFADRVFFCNSGAEANEAAFKFARKWSRKTEIVAFTGAFHGRLFASLAATDRPDYRKPFEPLLPGTRIVPPGAWAAVAHAAPAPRTASVI